MGVRCQRLVEIKEWGDRKHQGDKYLRVGVKMYVRMQCCRRVRFDEEVLSHGRA